MQNKSWSIVTLWCHCHDVLIFFTLFADARNDISLHCVSFKNLKQWVCILINLPFKTVSLWEYNSSLHVSKPVQKHKIKWISPIHGYFNEDSNDNSKGITILFSCLFNVEEISAVFTTRYLSLCLWIMFFFWGEHLLKWKCKALSR